MSFDDQWPCANANCRATFVRWVETVGDADNTYHCGAANCHGVVSADRGMRCASCRTGFCQQHWKSTGEFDPNDEWRCAWCLAVANGRAAAQPTDDDSDAESAPDDSDAESARDAVVPAVASAMRSLEAASAALGALLIRFQPPAAAEPPRGPPAEPPRGPPAEPTPAEPTRGPPAEPTRGPWPCAAAACQAAHGEWARQRALPPGPLYHCLRPGCHNGPMRPDDGMVRCAKCDLGPCCPAWYVTVGVTDVDTGRWWCRGCWAQNRGEVETGHGPAEVLSCEGPKCGRAITEAEGRRCQSCQKLFCAPCWAVTGAPLAARNTQYQCCSACHRQLS